MIDRNSILQLLDSILSIQYEKKQFEKKKKNENSVAQKPQLTYSQLNFSMK